MNNEIIIILIKALVLLLSGLITAVVVPYVKGKIGEDKYKEIKFYVEYAVRCAEQLYTPEQWAEKKKYVMQYILSKAKDLGIEMTEEDLNVLVEGIVNEVKHSKEYT